MIARGLANTKTYRHTEKSSFQQCMIEDTRIVYRKEVSRSKEKSA